jgi:hypothetical protein
MSGKAKSKGQKTQHEQEAAKHTPITAKENEFRLSGGGGGGGGSTIWRESFR